MKNYILLLLSLCCLPYAGLAQDSTAVTLQYNVVLDTAVHEQVVELDVLFPNDEVDGVYITAGSQTDTIAWMDQLVLFEDAQYGMLEAVLVNDNGVTLNFGRHPIFATVVTVRAHFLNGTLGTPVTVTHQP